MKYLRITLLFVLLCSMFDARSQFRGALSITPPSDALTIICVRDSLTGDPLVGAAIRIVSGADTINAASQKMMHTSVAFGVLEVNKRFRKPVEMTVDFLGYKQFRKSYAANEFRGAIQVQMAEDPKSITSIEVLGDRIAMIVRGDTTIYDAAAFKTIAGDKLGELLRQLPGVTVTETGIFANGAEIQRVYVDGMQFFGDDTLLALEDMTAADVKSIKVYDEDNPTAKRIGNKRAPKDKVMDVVTHSKPKIIRNIMVNLFAGTSTNKEYNGKHELRSSQYFVCGINKPTVNYRLEGFNNINDVVKNIRKYSEAPSASPGRSTVVQSSFSYRKGDSLSMNFDLGYEHGRVENYTTSQTGYFPTELYTLRQIEDVNQAMQNTDRYSAAGRFRVRTGRSEIWGGVNAKYATSQSSQLRNTIDRSDSKNTNQSQHTTGRGDSRSYSMSLHYIQGIGKGGSLRASATAKINDNTTDGWRVDTTGTTDFRTILRNDGRGKGRNVEASVQFSQHISKRSSLMVSYDMNYTYQLSRQISLDYLNNPSGVMDVTNTYDYTINQLRNKILLSYNYRGEKSLLSIGVKGGITTIGRDERLPEYYRLPYTFYSLAPTLSYWYDFTPQSNIYLRVDSDIENISVEQLRNVIIDINPMFLTVGNPHLKQPATTNGVIRMNKTVAEKSMSFSFSVSGNYTKDYIATKTLYFSESTLLEEYNYTAAAGSSLTTYENAGGFYNLSTELGFDKRFSSLGATLKAELTYGYSHIPFFLQQEARSTAQHQLRLDVNLVSGFSQYFKPEINSSTRAGIFTSGPYGRSRYLEEQLSGVIRVNFAKRYLMNTMVTYTMYRNDKSRQSDRDDVYWNIEAGRTFGKNNQMKMLVGVVDLLNRSANRVVTIKDDYINTQTKSILGRYWFVNVSYIF